MRAGGEDAVGASTNASATRDSEIRDDDAAPFHPETGPSRDCARLAAEDARVAELPAPPPRATGLCVWGDVYTIIVNIS